MLVRSNIGGQGGRCNLQTDGVNDCAEFQADAFAGLQEMYVENIGTNTLWPGYGDDVGNGAQIDLIVTNISEYRSWDTRWNWVKKEKGESDVGGGFVGTNLAGARTAGQARSGWSDTFTACEFRYEFVTSAARNAPRIYNADGTIALADVHKVKIPRTYVSFYDFDEGVGSFEGSASEIQEAMQMDPQAKDVQTARVTELTVYDSWESVPITL
jgi:hypothetical protein